MKKMTKQQYDKMLDLIIEMQLDKAISIAEFAGYTDMNEFLTDVVKIEGLTDKVLFALVRYYEQTRRK